MRYTAAMNLRCIAIALFGLAACGESTEPTATPAAAGKCVDTLARKPTGNASCAYCAAGQVFEPGAGTCIAVGPPECRVAHPKAADLDGSLCTPVWCPFRADAQGQPCALTEGDCIWRGASCDPAAAAAATAPAECPVGTLPSADGLAACVAAGDDVRDVNGLLPATAGLALALVPAWAELPDASVPAHLAGETALPIACRDGSGDPHDCARGELGCPVGYLPAAQANSCEPVRGPEWTCPPGFVASGKAAFEGGLPGCAPDPAACGEAGVDEFGWFADQPGTVYVSAANTAGPWSGTRTAPYSALGPAFAAAMGSGKVAVAAGTYKGNFVLTGSVQVVGRCPKLVSVEGSIAAPTFAAKGKASGVLLRGLTVRGGFGGLAVTDGALVAASDLHIVHSAVNGVYVSGAATVKLTNVLVDEVQAHPDGSLGMGILAVKGAKLTISDVRVRRARLMATYVEGPNTWVDGSGLLLDNTQADGSKALGNGLVVSEAANVDLVRFRAHANPGLQVMVMGKGTGALLRRARIDHSQTGGSYKQLGFGLAVSEDGALGVHDALVVANTVTGAIATGAGSLLSLNRVHVAGTQAAGQTADLGDGLDVAAGARAHLNTVRITGNRSAGLRLYGQGSVVTAKRLLVDHTLPSAKGDILGLGINVLEGAELQLREARVSSNRASGLVAQDPGSRVVATDLVVDDTLPEAASGGLGQGLVVSGGQALLKRAVLAGNHGIGIGVELPGSRLEAAGLLVRDTRPREKDGLFGVALQARDKAEVLLHGSRLQGGHLAAVSLSHGATATLVGVAIADVQPQLADGIHGGGVWVAHGGVAHLRSCALRNLASAAVATRLGTLDVRGSVLHGVTAAPTWSRSGSLGPVIGDGVLAIDAQGLRIADTLIGGYARAGAMLDGAVQTAATADRSAWSGGTFGLVLQRKATLARTATWIAGASQQNVAGDSGLSVPQAPELADLSLPKAPKPGF